MSDIDDYDNDAVFALVADTPGGLLYWSLTKGWTHDENKAWKLSQAEVDSIEDDEALQSKLPQQKEWKEASWERIGRFLSDTRFDDGDDLSTR